MLFSHLADTLLVAGYKGYFDSATANRTIPAPMQGGTLQPPPSPSGFREPWPYYMPTKCTEILVPPTLHATLPVPFSLTPPHPTGVHFHRFIRHYLKQHETMRELTSLLFIWTRSLRMDEFTPSCLALMVMHYFQVRRRFSSSFLLLSDRIVSRLFAISPLSTMLVIQKGRRSMRPLRSP